MRIERERGEGRVGYTACNIGVNSVGRSYVLVGALCLELRVLTRRAPIANFSSYRAASALLAWHPAR